MGGELWRFDDTQLMAETLAVSAEIHTAQVHRMDLMIAMYERDTVTEHGYRSPAHWLCAATHLEIDECHRIESLARLLRLEPEVRTAYSSGLLDAEKARQIAYFCQHYPRTMNPCDFDKARTILIDHASEKVGHRAVGRAAGTRADPPHRQSGTATRSHRPRRWMRLPRVFDTAGLGGCPPHSPLGRRR
ncbi:uncharacterized protein DUF222 [Rhodococcus sp. SMB37]|uniref:DUF222 domain-containing protein n=1 Tax=Rhodococcus sp. SMB37 TaxID=2512213 RepID=UPI0010E54160|nr:DUF222 domain-containing protein [Rhodococcus sp. SMB37]TCN45840.1 uncharacterized protein DUF222 [Rhodococcus sp. SMB37]